MNQKIVISTLSTVACLGIFFITPASAQSATGIDMMSQHHQKQAEMMKDMAQAMGGMTEQMSHDPTPEQAKQMGLRMERMSTMMHRMAGLENRPAMKDPEFQKQMGPMRKQMSEMMRDMPMGAK